MSNTGRGRVFVTQENPNIDYTKAEQFGEIIFLTRDEPSHISGSLRNGGIMEQVATKLMDFLPDHDYICPSGSPVVCGLAFFILSKLPQLNIRKNTPLRVLRWSNRDKMYLPITLLV